LLIDRELAATSGTAEYPITVSTPFASAWTLVPTNRASGTGWAIANPDGASSMHSVAPTASPVDANREPVASICAALYPGCYNAIRSGSTV
jgi:hypothetical protein